MNFRPLDILAFWGRDPVSQAISYGTAWQYGFRRAPSHVGVICRTPADAPERPLPPSLLVESTMLAPRPCLVQRLHVRGCQAQDPIRRIAEYDGRVRLLRLVPIESLSHDESQLASRVLLDHFVRPGVGYDTGHALLSALRRRNLITWFFEDFDDDPLERMFCSELVAKVLQRLGRLARNGSQSYSPARLVRKLLRSGVYADLGDARQMVGLRLAEGTA